MINFQNLYESARNRTSAWGIINKIKILLQCFYFYLAFAGIFGFSLFIAEEIMQINMWANFAASDVQRTDLILKNCATIEKTNNISKLINKYCMWLLPPQKWAYTALGEGVDVYLETQRAYVLAISPELFLGQKIKLDFKYDSYAAGKNKLVILKSRKVKVIVSKLPDGPVVKVTGVVQLDPELSGGVIIREGS